MDDLLELSGQLGVEFGDLSLLSRALTHRSYLNENADSSLEDNERLEFLGDAVIDFIVAGYLYNRYPELDEGDLTALRAALVRAETLAQFARAVDLGRYLRLGYGEEESGGRDRTPLLCATFEAVIGAIYLDRGLERARPIVEGYVKPMLERIRAGDLQKDAKSEFQVWAQAKFNATPHYRVVDSEGPDHAKTFTVRVMVGKDDWGEGRGRSKQAAAQAAAAEALSRAEVFPDRQNS
ncbi:MAG: ribonuclease III [Candidatus Promineofilum sp.]|nr:ribonuclease III [Promineifilum sp.]